MQRAILIWPWSSQHMYDTLLYTFKTETRPETPRSLYPRYWESGDGGYGDPSVVFEKSLAVSQTTRETFSVHVVKDTGELPPDLVATQKRRLLSLPLSANECAAVVALVCPGDVTEELSEVYAVSPKRTLTH